MYVTMKSCLFEKKEAILFSQTREISNVFWMISWTDSNLLLTQLIFKCTKHRFLDVFFIITELAIKRTFKNSPTYFIIFALHFLLGTSWLYRRWFVSEIMKDYLSFYDWIPAFIASSRKHARKWHWSSLKTLISKWHMNLKGIHVSGAEDGPISKSWIKAKLS